MITHKKKQIEEQTKWQTMSFQSTKIGINYKIPTNTPNYLANPIISKNTNKSRTSNMPKGKCIFVK